MGAAYYIGFAASCLYTAKLIKAFGHIRVFAAMAAIASAGSLLLLLALDPVAWILIRAAMGFCFAGLLMVVESWIAESSQKSDRAKLLSIYTMVDLVAVAGSQFLLPLYGIHAFHLFAIMAMAFALSLVPISLSDRSRPNPPEDPTFDFRKIWVISPLASVAVLAIGMTNSAFRLIGPLYGREVGLDVTDIAIFMSAGIVGGAIMQYPLGTLSDRFDRRWVVIVATAGAMLAGIFLTAVAGHTPTLIYIGSFLFGAFAMPLYSLSAAHANDYAKPGQFVLVSAGLLFFYAVGSSVGPIVASLVIDYFGAPAFFAYTSIVHGALIVAALFRMTRREAMPADERGDFVALLRTSPAAIFRISRRGRPKSSEKTRDKPLKSNQTGQK